MNLPVQAHSEPSRRSESVRNRFVAFVTGTTLLGTVALVPLIAENHVIGTTVPMLLGDIADMELVGRVHMVHGRRVLSVDLSIEPGRACDAATERAR